MKVRLKLTLDCPPDTAWDLLNSPGAFTAVTRPLLSFAPVGNAALPDRWSEGVYPVHVSGFFALVPLGEQDIDIRWSTKGDARIFTDAGGPTSGSLTLIRRWRHRMAVSPAPDGRTLFRDQLEFRAGLAGPLLWPVLWFVWQWRAGGLRKLAARMPKV